MTGDSGQTGEGGEVQEEMEEGQQMEGSVDGGRNVEVKRQTDQEEEMKWKNGLNK